MRCIHCRYPRTQVKNSRGKQSLLLVWRRRYCSSCKRVFTTTETALADNLFVIKSNKKRQRFVYEKLFASVFSVLNFQKKRDNGNDSLLARAVSQTVVKKALAQPSVTKTIPTSTLITLVYTELKNVDKALAEHYIYYSDYRRKVGVKIGVVK